jgi:hypothetical protein
VVAEAVVGVAVSSSQGRTTPLGGLAVVSAALCVVSVAVLLLRHLASATRGPFDICLELTGTTTEGPVGFTQQNSVLPYGFYCIEPGMKPVFYDLGTIWLIVAVAGLIATAVLTFAWARWHLTNSASNA